MAETIALVGASAAASAPAAGAAGLGTAATALGPTFLGAASSGSLFTVAGLTSGLTVASELFTVGGAALQFLGGEQQASAEEKAAKFQARGELLKGLEAKNRTTEARLRVESSNIARAGATGTDPASSGSFLAGQVDINQAGKNAATTAFSSRRARSFAAKASGKRRAARSSIAGIFSASNSLLSLAG